MGVQLRDFLTSPPRASDSFKTRLFYAGKTLHGTRWLRGWLGSRAGLLGLEKTTAAGSGTRVFIRDKRYRVFFKNSPNFG